MNEYEKILRFWFSQQMQPYWFKKSQHLDMLINKRFLKTFLLAKNGELTDWSKTARGRLALIIVLDQFPRNIFRNSKKAYSGDKRAQTLAREGIKKKHDRELTVSERSFFYMPLMHSESREIQKESVKQFRKLARIGGKNLRWATLHKKIVDEYGRFPHRNKILRRKSTKKERIYLAQPSAGF